MGWPMDEERHQKALERYKRNTRERKLRGGRPLHPDVINRRKSAGGRKTAEMIKQGIYYLPVPGKGHKG